MSLWHNMLKWWRRSRKHNCTFRQTATCRESDQSPRNWQTGHSGPFQPDFHSVCRVSRQVPHPQVEKGELRNWHVSLPNIYASAVQYYCSVHSAFLFICWHPYRHVLIVHQAQAMSLMGTHQKNTLQLLVCATRPEEKLLEKLDWRSCFVQKD